MKKLMIAVAIICAAAMSQAANFLWSTAKNGPIYLMNSTDKMTSGTAYLFYATDAATVYNAWNGGNTSLASISGSLDNSPISASGGVNTKTTSPISLDVDTLNAILVTETTVEGKKYLFISGVGSKDSITPGNAGLQFTSDQMGAAKSPATEWKSGGYAGAGWYSAAAVPEPTSGLLLLLGVAGLALRRRRA